jgi:type I restriction enzyme S subunit
MSWKKLLFKDFITLQRGFDLPKTQMKEGEVPVLGSNCIIGYHNESKVAPQGVVTGRSGTLGVVQFIEKDFWPHNTALWVKDFKGNIPRFVYYKLQTLHLENFNGGASVPTLNRNVLDTLPVSAPDVETQSKIATMLSNYDDLIENNRRRIRLLERSLHLLYKEWFVHLRFPSHEHSKIVDGIPEGWKTGTVADFYKTSSGGTPSRKRPEFFTGEINWVKTQELNEGFIFSSDEKITEEAVKCSSAKVFPEETVLVAMYGATIGQTAILAVPAATNQACCGIIPNYPNAHYIHAFLFFRENKQGLMNLSQGSAQNNISQEIIKTYPMVLPTKMLMAQFVDYSKPVFRQIKNLSLQNRQLQQARDLLLPKLMSGAIGV